jgi:NADH-quinone oxidoreductase subunit H
VPLAAGFAVADVRTGIVVVGAAEALTFVAVYLHGWGPNSLLALIGGYRFVAFGLSFVLLSMFVLIGAALPAESLAVGEIVESQRSLWNVVRQPLGLPLFLVVILGVSLRPPLAAADGTDLAGGTAAESSGPQLLAWELAKRLMLVAYALVAASVFVGGYLGPLLPGPVWLGVKTVAILAVVQAIGHLVGRVPTPRFVSVAWTVLLPLSFFGLAAAGVQAL